MALILVLGHKAGPLLPGMAWFVLSLGGDPGMAGELLTTNPQAFHAPDSLSPQSWPCSLVNKGPWGKSLFIRLIPFLHNRGSRSLLAVQGVFFKDGATSAYTRPHAWSTMWT